MDMSISWSESKKEEEDGGSDRYGIFLYYEPKEEVLVVRHKASHYWGFPKGGLMKGEEPHECALREFEEETGLKDLVKISKTSDSLNCGSHTYYVVRCQRRYEIDSRKLDSREITHCTWISFHELSWRRVSMTTSFVVSIFRNILRDDRREVSAPVLVPVLPSLKSHPEVRTKMKILVQRRKGASIAVAV